MSDPADVEALAQAHYEYRSELDLLVLAAGVGSGAPRCTGLTCSSRSM
jgi:hypothetical protein